MFSVTSRHLPLPPVISRHGHAPRARREREIMNAEGVGVQGLAALRAPSHGVSGHRLPSSQQGRSYLMQVLYRAARAAVLRSRFSCRLAIVSLFPRVLSLFVDPPHEGSWG